MDIRFLEMHPERIPSDGRAERESRHFPCHPDNAPAQPQRLPVRKGMPHRLPFVPDILVLLKLMPLAPRRLKCQAILNVALLQLLVLEVILPPELIHVVPLRLVMLPFQLCQVLPPVDIIRQVPFFRALEICQSPLAPVPLDFLRFPSEAQPFALPCCRLLQCCQRLPHSLRLPLSAFAQRQEIHMPPTRVRKADDQHPLHNRIARPRQEMPAAQVGKREVAILRPRRQDKPLGDFPVLQAKILKLLHVFCHCHFSTFTSKSEVYWIM